MRADAHDLKTFFTVVTKEPIEVVAADVFDFLAHQRGDRKVVRISDRESGLSARTIARRLSSVAGFYAYLVARGDTALRSNPVPRGLSTRRRAGRSQTVPLVPALSHGRGDSDQPSPSYFACIRASSIRNFGRMEGEYLLIALAQVYMNFCA